MRVGDDTQLRKHKHRRHQDNAATFISAVQSEQHGANTSESVENVTHHCQGRNVNVALYAQLAQ
jgi:uncharacterized protein VirK/YbjX